MALKCQASVIRNWFVSVITASKGRLNNGFTNCVSKLAVYYEHMVGTLHETGALARLARLVIFADRLNG